MANLPACTDPGHLRPLQGQRRRRARLLHTAAHEGREKAQASRHSAQLREYIRFLNFYVILRTILSLAHKSHKYQHSYEAGGPGAEQIL